MKPTALTAADDGRRIHVTNQHGDKFVGRYHHPMRIRITPLSISVPLNDNDTITRLED